MTAPLFDRVAIVGAGLIGGSLAHACRRGGLARHVAIADTDPGHRAEAERLRLGDSVHADAAEAAAGADLAVLAVPVGAMAAAAAALAPGLAPGAILTDVGSVKAEVLAAVAPHVPPGVHFIPGHPLAGTEHSGPGAGFASLFEGKFVLLTPPEGADPDATARLRALWEGCGATVEEMEAEHHDLVVAVTSHVPHLIAYTMVGVADHLRRVTSSEIIRYSAGGFRDFTRIAASDPTMWRDVFLNNKEATLDILGRFTEELFVLQRAIRMEQGEELHAYFTRTRAIRRGILEAGQDVDAPDFGRVKRDG